MTTSSSSNLHPWMPIVAGAIMLVAAHGTVGARIIHENHKADAQGSAGLSKPIATKAIGLDRAANGDKIENIATDPWMTATLRELEFHRVRKSQSADMLAMTEVLASHFSIFPTKTRPKLFIDDDGISNFATSSEGVYFHLTLDSMQSISWLADVQGEEDAEDDVFFDGNHLPPKLFGILI